MCVHADVSKRHTKVKVTSSIQENMTSMTCIEEKEAKIGHCWSIQKPAVSPLARNLVSVKAE